MKRAVLLLLLLFSLSAVAQTPDPTPLPGATPVADKVDPEAVKAPENPAHDELRKLRDQMQTAMNGRDIEGLLAGVTEDVVFSTMNGDVVRGKDAIREYFAKMLDGPDALVKSVSTNFEADDLTLLYGGSLGEPETAGVAFGHAKDSYVLRDGSTFEVEPRWTATMIREPDGWKVASFHYSVNVFDNPVLNKVTSLAKTAGIAAGLGGLFVGLLIGYLMGKRKGSS